ncbi:MAG TPA: acetyl-CoA hydrolase/transferase C-terminal domain-containing protein, partial [Acidimicrobiia bacterium]|nr:acetyl-CoA hydrolase/transferase C-terminal domain-containing protein [Acidimicrobiia bacterium]
MARECTLEEAVALVRPADTLAIPLGPGAPGAFLRALGARDDWQDLQVFGGLLLDLYAFLTKPGVRYVSGFFGPAERVLLDMHANIEFVPADFRRFITLARRFTPRIMTTVATPPDPHGWMSLSLHAGATVDELHRAGADPDRVLIVETNPALPRTIGIPPQFPHALHVGEVDVLVPGDRPLFELPEPASDDVERAIAAHARPFITDGATLQTGIGGIPSSVVALLADDDGGDYGVHSEMFTTGLMRLHQAGKVTNARKGEFVGMSVTTFALGTAELYSWLHENAAVRFLPVDVVNAPHTIARNHKMVSINGALAVDLYGQIVADRIHGRQFSGIGGHEDFVAQSGLDLEDRSLICFPSTAKMGEEAVSRIIPSLPAGTTVTTPRHQTDIVITEYGVAELRGATMRERAQR